MKPWQVRDRFLNLETRWFTLIGEHLETPSGDLLEYWRVARSHSLIVVSLQAGALVLPTPTYRPGVGQSTLDFPGGRVPADASLDVAAQQILQRELGISPTDITDLALLNAEGWPINSSFSNQRLFGMVAQLAATSRPALGHLRFTVDTAGITSLLSQLTCLQCRAVLREWQMLQQGVNRPAQDVH